MRVEIVKPNLEGFTGNAMLVKRGEEYFVVSSVVAMFTGFETLVFAADSEGNVTSWTEVAGGRGMYQEEAIQQLEEGIDYRTDYK